MNKPADKLERTANLIASAFFTAVILTVIGFLWINASADVKRDFYRAAAEMTKVSGEFIKSIFVRNGGRSTATSSNDARSVRMQRHSDLKSSSVPVPPFAVPVPPPIHKHMVHGKPIQFIKKTVSGVPLYETIVGLHDPETYIAVGLANNATRANDKDETHGDELFDSFVKKAHASVVMNGTFFSKDSQKRVMGNMVSGGRLLKYSPWENFGTTFGLTAGNIPVMITARAESVPRWDEHWFSLTCGPRLVKDGSVWLTPRKEGFADSHVLGVGPRCALGYTENGDKLILVTFMNGLSLEAEAKLMKELGCYQAMNLDGGASRALAYGGNIIVPAGRPLTNVLMVYDAKNKAPHELAASWLRFQKGHHTFSE